jgi:predicted ATP-grasp superfamily ATP-dependent carboligase
VIESGRILLFGASTRAAAFSALRAALRPWCCDLFADRDLQAHCPVVSVRGKYPDSFLEALRTAPPGQWMYTGGLENHPRLVRTMADQRGLWGNDATALKRVRNPSFVAEVVRAAGLPAPEVVPIDRADINRRWLVKPRKSAGGLRMTFLTCGRKPDLHYYVQEYVEGTPVAAIFVGNGRGAQLLGVTRQLIGASFCHARAFQYCGSVGPLAVGERMQSNLVRLGDALTARCQLRGLFGLDGVLRGADFWPVEVNPRYTASVEVLEYATGLQALAWHRAVFDAAAPRPLLPAGIGDCVGKAILLARRDVVFPGDGPWEVGLGTASPDKMPAFADVPVRGERIMAGRPVLTFFAQGGTAEECESALRAVALDLDRRLFGS